MKGIPQETMTGRIKRHGQRLTPGVAAAMSLALLFLTTACGAAQSTSDGPAAQRESPPSDQSQQAASSAQSQPASQASQPQSSAQEPKSQPDGLDSQALTEESDSAGTASRPALRILPKDTANIGAQPMVSTAHDPISTFSLDTDRASYQRALELAQAGHDIDPAEVRAEEWINSLNYGYPKPSQAGEFAIHTDIFQHPDTQGMHMARIGIQAPDAQEERHPVNVTLVLDSSGSMRDGNRVEIARQAAYTIVDNMNARDQVAVIHFEHMVTRDKTVPHTSSNNPSVKRSLDRLVPGGSTNVQAGLDEGLEMAYQARADNPGTINYLILFSDGVANVDATNPFAILDKLGEGSEYSRPNPVRIITIGVGIQGYNDHLLEQLAQNGNGWYRYLDNPQQARATFSRKNWQRLTTPFADQARAQVTWDPELVSHWRIVGYENRVTPDSSFTQNLRKFAEIPAGTATTVLYELELTSRMAERRAATAKLAEIEIRWVEPVTGVSREQYSAVSGAWRENFAGLKDHSLRLGVIAGLSADIYANLDDGGYGTGGQDAPHRLSILVDELQALNPALGGQDAYQDIEMLVERLEQQAPRHARRTSNGRGSDPSQGSGYSP